MIHQLLIDDGIIIAVAESNLLSEGWVEVDQETANIAILNLCRSRLVDGAIETFEPPPPIPTVSDYQAAIQGCLDSAARERGYDSMLTAVGYRGDPNPGYAAEAEALFAWRSQVWTRVFAEIGKVESGEREQPSVDEMIAELPAIVWPA